MVVATYSLLLNHQVLHNLLGNAVKFTATGSVTARLSIAVDNYTPEDDQSEFVIVVDAIDQAGDAGMKKSGIADETDHLMIGGLGKAAGRSR